MYKTYQQAIESASVIEVVPFQVATDTILNTNLRACFENDAGLKDLLDQAVLILNQQISDAVASVRGGVPVDGDTLKKLNDKILVINNLLNSNDVNLDTMQELVNFMKNNADYITNLSISKVNVSDIVDSVISTEINKPLSANQGKILYDLVQACVTTTALSQLLLSKSDTNHVHALASAVPAVSGFMSASDKQKLDGVAEGANNYTHPASHPASMIDTDPTHMFSTLLQQNRWDDTYTQAQVDSKDATVLSLLKGAVSGAYDSLAKIETKFNQLDVLLSSTDVNLDTVQEIINAIKSNQGLIDSLMTSKVNVSDIIDNLVTAVTNKPLSANQGYILKTLVDQKANSSDVYTRSQVDVSLTGKVSVVAGKGLSTNDFDNTYKSKLDTLNTINGASVVTLSSQTVSSGNQYILGANGLTLTLPLNPTTGMQIEILDGAGINTSTTISGNGAMVEGVANFVMDVPQFWVKLIYVNPTYGWRVFGF